MSMADHPAGRAHRCADDTCTERPVARVVAPGGFAIVRPLDSANARGVAVCVEHAHVAIDLMLLRATPEPTR